MTWILLALFSPLLYAMSNHLDKYIIEKYLKGEDDEGSAGSLVLFTALFGILVLPVAYFFDSGIFSLSTKDISLLVLTGALFLGATWLYLHALIAEEASNVVPFWQTSPIFGFIFAYLIIGETLTSLQGAAALFIILGGALLSLEWDDDGKIRIKWKLVITMLASSLLFGLNDVLVKEVAIEAGYAVSIFWTYAGYAALGMLVYLASKKYRDEFHELFKYEGPTVMGLNISGELLAIAGDSAIRFATLLAPVALVAAVSDGFQPLLVLILGVVLTSLIPGITFETINKRELSKKLGAIALMGVGAVFLYFVGV